MLLDHGLTAVEPVPLFAVLAALLLALLLEEEPELVLEMAKEQLVPGSLMGLGLGVGQLLLAPLATVPLVRHRK
jgi:hypothetical protein